MPWPKLWKKEKLRPAYLGETIGPSPWYFRDRAVKDGSRLVPWRSPGEETPYAMCTVLGESEATTTMAVGGMSYFRMLTDDLMLLWTPASVARPAKPTAMVFQLHSLGTLTALGDVKAACTEIFEGRSSVVTSVPPHESFTIPVNLSAGVHRLEFPSWLGSVDELLVLVDGPDSSWERGDRRIWSLRPPKGELEVLPQDWFNNAGHDFGYEWISRVSRDQDGRIIGDGVRIWPFRLDETGRGLAESLKRSPLGEPW